MQMKSLTVAAILVAIGITSLVAAQEAPINVPLKDFRVGIANGFETALTLGDGSVARGDFSKAGAERRLLAIQAVPVGPVTGVKALVVRYRLQLAEGAPPSLAVVAFDEDGGSWYRVGEAMSPGEPAEGRVSLSGLRPTAFSATPGAELVWNKVTHLWFGFAADGAVRGTVDFQEARLTNEPYRPSRPLIVTGDNPGQWGLSQDPAVVSTLTTPNEGPDGRPCMKYEFTVPAGRHMYCIPGTSVPTADVEGYTGLRFTYKATIPQGQGNLLVSVQERGGAQYYADPGPPPSAEWTTVTLPFSTFKFATWSRDDNNQLDLAELARVNIGCHGTPQGENLQGLIMVCDIQFVP